MQVKCEKNDNSSEKLPIDSKETLLMHENNIKIESLMNSIVKQQEILSNEPQPKSDGFEALYTCSICMEAYNLEY